MLLWSMRFVFRLPKRFVYLNSARFFSGSKMDCDGVCNIAVCQLTSTVDKAANLNTVRRLVSEAAKKQAKIVFLPEACDYIPTSKDESRSLAETLDGSLLSSYKSLAKEHGLWLSLGGIHELVKENDNVKLHNSHVIIDDKGKIVSVYRKLHLFDVTIPEKNVYLKESDYINGGQSIVDPIDTPAGLIGLSICYDMRFPELSVLLRKKGAQILTFPSAFTNTTGQAHWETLLKARAIENQCYVVAAAQYGQHNKKRVSFGQALIIDPWGKIVAECPKYNEDCPSNESVAVATVNKALIAKIRKEMPVFNHRRNDLYELKCFSSECTKPSSPFDRDFKFADKTIPGSTVFYVSQHSYAFTNIRCVVPGHVLVSSLRWAKRLQDLTLEEVNDLFQTCVKVQKAVEKKYEATSSTICLQDGKDAGQTVPQVHVHIMPRTPGDFAKNDDIYMELARHDRDENPEPIRDIQEMSDEALQLRKIIS